jgi:phosphoribosylaminoimidazolecarboxamide formyltransferase/IMP cyclohydrolase
MIQQFLIILILLNNYLFKTQINDGVTLRYGENPHQKGVFYGDMNAMFEKLNGKELSYNNLLDVDAAVALMADFTRTNFCYFKT